MEMKRTVPFYVTYTCSKCGNEVKTLHFVQESITVTEQNTMVWEDKSGNTNDIVDNKKKVEFDKKVNKIFKEQQEGLYREAEFNCKCNNCNHKEPWSK